MEAQGGKRTISISDLFCSSLLMSFLKSLTLATTQVYFHLWSLLTSFERTSKLYLHFLHLCRRTLFQPSWSKLCKSYIISTLKADPVTIFNQEELSITSRVRSLTETTSNSITVLSIDVYRSLTPQYKIIPAWSVCMSVSGKLMTAYYSSATTSVGCPTVSSTAAPSNNVYFRNLNSERCTRVPAIYTKTSEEPIHVVPHLKSFGKLLFSYYPTSIAAPHHTKVARKVRLWDGQALHNQAYILYNRFRLQKTLYRLDHYLSHRNHYCMLRFILALPIQSRSTQKYGYSRCLSLSRNFMNTADEWKSKK